MKLKVEWKVNLKVQKMVVSLDCSMVLLWVDMKGKTMVSLMGTLKVVALAVLSQIDFSSFIA